VIEFNQAFTDLFGYELSDGPYTPPFPWWPTEEEDSEAWPRSRDSTRRGSAARSLDSEVVLYTKDRRKIWVHTSGASVELPYSGLTAKIRVLRDITRDKQAQERRAAART
jgi:PAS domain S-box-containing protein